MYELYFTRGSSAQCSSGQLNAALCRFLRFVRFSLCLLLWGSELTNFGHFVQRAKWALLRGSYKVWLQVIDAQAQEQSRAHDKIVLEKMIESVEADLLGLQKDFEGALTSTR